MRFERWQVKSYWAKCIDANGEWPRSSRLDYLQASEFSKKAGRLAISSDQLGRFLTAGAKHESYCPTLLGGGLPLAAYDRLCTSTTLEDSILVILICNPELLFGLKRLRQWVWRWRPLVSSRTTNRVTDDDCTGCVTWLCRKVHGVRRSCRMINGEFRAFWGVPYQTTM